MLEIFQNKNSIRLKRIIILLCVFSLFGCKESLKDWQVSRDNISKVTITDYNGYEIELNNKDYTNIIESYNSIETISLNEEFTDEAIFGKPIYSIFIKYIDSTVVLEISELGYVGLWRNGEQFGTYYNVDIFEDFHNILRSTIQINEMSVNDMSGVIGEDKYIKLPFSHKNDYLVSGEIRIEDFLAMINKPSNMQEESLNDYLKNYIKSPMCNDEIILDNITYKILGVDEGDIVTVYVRI